MSEKKLNCWEYKQCGREPGGDKALEVGICPSTTDTKYNGINDGTNAGRCCWHVAGTLCGGKIQGVFAHKIGNCKNCDFFKKAQQEEDNKFILKPNL